MAQEFHNDDTRLRERAEEALQTRKDLGLEGLTGDLQAVIINVPEDHREAAVQEMLDYTGYDVRASFEDADAATCVLGLAGSADFLIRTRKQGGNPFLEYSTGPKSAHMPEARLETFVYKCHDLERYVALQKKRGTVFQTPEPVRGEHFDFIQTMPSPYTGNAIGMIEWRGVAGQYHGRKAEPGQMAATKPDNAFLGRIGRLDHSATRVQARERDDAIIEFMGITDYNFQFAVYVDNLNSITNVARLNADAYAQVFTSGVKPFETPETSGPTELFIHNFGLRVHHLAFDTTQIEDTFQELKDAGLGFLVELVGGPDEGLFQTFSNMSPHTFLVNEYIHRFEGFTGFFTQSNVQMLTKATEKQ